jgi:hypothetical protein
VDIQAQAPCLRLSMKIDSAVVGNLRDGHRCHVESAAVQIWGVNMGPVRSWTRRGNLGKVASWPRLISISHPNNQVGAREDWYAEGKYPLESLDLLRY